MATELTVEEALSHVATLDRKVDEITASLRQDTQEAFRQLQTLQGGSGTAEPLSLISGWKLNSGFTDANLTGAASFVAQGQMLLAGHNITFTRPANTPFLQINMAGGFACYDYAVCSSGCGTHMKLFGAGGAFQAAVADGLPVSTIYMCNSETAAASEDFSGMTKSIVIIGHSGSGLAGLSAGADGTTPRIVLTGPTGTTSVFTTTGTAPGAGAMLTFINIGVTMNAGQAWIDQKLVNGTFRAEFHRVGFVAGGAYLTTNILTVNGRGMTLLLRDCAGSLGYFTDYNSVAGSGQRPTVITRNCTLTMNGLFHLTTDPAGAGNALASLDDTGSTFTFLASQSLNKGSDFYWRGTQFKFGVAATLFPVTASPGNVTHIFSSVIFVVTSNVAANLYSWTPVVAGATLTFNDVVGISGVAQAGTFISITNPPTISTGVAIVASRWATASTGLTAPSSASPSITGNLLVSGYGRFGSLVAPVNVTAGDLTAARLSVGNVAIQAGAVANIVGALDLNNIALPANPAANYIRMFAFAKATGAYQDTPRWLDSSGHDSGPVMRAHNAIPMPLDPVSMALTNVVPSSTLGIIGMVRQVEPILLHEISYNIGTVAAGINGVIRLCVYTESGALIINTTDSPGLVTGVQTKVLAADVYLPAGNYKIFFCMSVNETVTNPAISCFTQEGTFRAVASEDILCGTVVVTAGAAPDPHGTITSTANCTPYFKFGGAAT